jgi:hypothetical protein
MPVKRRPSPLAEFLRRLLAAGAAALVLALGVFAASPELHQWLHGHDGLTKDDSCAVVLFASGASAPAAAIAVPLPPTEWQAWSHPSVTEIFLASPRYLHQPERGPPVS